MNNIKVPKGMLIAASKDVLYTGEPNSMKALELRLEAALRWLSENPIVPTGHGTCEEMHRTVNAKGYCCYQSALLAEWQRRMFFAPEPEVPEGIKDLLSRHATDTSGSDTLIRAMARGHNADVIEAFRRGQKIQREK